MSAPVTRDPLVVNTKDGVTWVRRAATRDGRGLYAVTDSCKCPPYLMVTLVELAEHGIAGQADVLPMPVGPGPLKPSVDADRAMAPWGRGEDGRPLLPMGAHWTDVPELVDQHLSGMQARVDQAQSGSWFVSSTAGAPGTVCARVDGYHRTVGQFTNMLPADLELVLHAHDDLGWCLDMVAKLRARVAELEAAAYGDAEVRLLSPVEQIRHLHACVAAQLSRADTLNRLCREQRARADEAAARVAELEGLLSESMAYAAGLEVQLAGVEKTPFSLDAEESADKLTRLLAPTQALREDPHDGPLRHDYRVGRDLPASGGA